MVEDTSTPSTSLRLEFGSASSARTVPFSPSIRFLIISPLVVVLPTPPFPAMAIFLLIDQWDPFKN